MSHRISTTNAGDGSITKIKDHEQGFVGSWRRGEGGDIDVGLLCDNPLRLRAVHSLAHVQAVCMWAIIVGSMDELGQRTISRNVGSKSPTKGRRRGFRRSGRLAQMTGGCAMRYVDMFMLLKSCFGGRQDSRGWGPWGPAWDEGPLGVCPPWSSRWW